MKCWITALALTTVLLPAAAAADEDLKRATQDLQGAWRVTKIEHDKNTSVGNAEVKAFLFQGNMFILTDGERIVDKFKLDVSRKPKWLDTTVRQGVYALEGNDLKILWLAPRAERPAAVTFTPDQGQMLVHLTRDIQPFDEDDRIAITFAEESQRFGIAILRLKDPRDPKKPKRLLGDERGATNNTVVRIDGTDHIFGTAKAGSQWTKIDGKTYKGIKDGTRRWQSAMDFADSKVRITQTVEIVVGEQTRLYDTALVSYHIENLDSKPHKVGLRALIDTCIGGNPGQPIFIPPSTRDEQATLVDGKTILEGKKIPAFLRTLESLKLDNEQTTVAEMGFAIKGLEALDKLVICRWPHDKGGSEAGWDWPYRAIDDPKDKPKSTCVVLYWAQAEMRPGAKRLCGFTYGLGRVSAVPRRADDK
jgi:uncharacterized protein (TIGR03067 family)